MTLDMMEAPPGFVERSHPEHRADQREELVSLAGKIHVWQERQGLSDNEMIRRFPDLGSDKTYRTLRRGETDGLRVPSHLSKYRSVWQPLEAMIGAAGSEEIYPDLDPAITCREGAALLALQRGKTRLLMIEAPTGGGKTESLKVIAGLHPNCILIEAHEGWDSVTCALKDILVAVRASQKVAMSQEDVAALPNSKAALLTLLVAALQQERKMLGIDEGHHCCAGVLNALKTLLNKTDVQIILAAIGTLWRKLSARNWEEVRQLVYNRMVARLVLAAPTPGETEIFLTRRLPSIGGPGWHRAFKEVATHAGSFGRYAFLRELAVDMGKPDVASTPDGLVAASLERKKLLEAR